MSKIDTKTPKLGSVLITTTGKPVYEKNVLKGTINPIMPDERNSEAEVKIGITIRDLKFGNKAVIEPEAVTIYHGTKNTIAIPFKEELIYWFSRVENDMVFKYAVTSSGDLLGFIYLEVPIKFKSMKEFKLDDWFPIKLADREDGSVVIDNFMARIVINYTAKRALEQTALFPLKLPKSKLYEELAKGMKARVAELHRELDLKDDEGFRYLTEVQKKIMRKKILQREIKRDKSPNQTGPLPELPLNAEVSNQERAKGVIANDEKVKQAQLKPDDLFKFTEADWSEETPEAKEKLMKELGHTRAVYVDAKNQLASMEAAQTSPENHALRKKVEAAMDDIARDKKELAFRLKDQNNDWQREKASAEEQIAGPQGENEQLKAELAKLEVLLKESSDKTKTKKTSADDLENKVQKLRKEVGAKEDICAKLRTSVMKDNRSSDQIDNELSDARSKMIAERQKILERNEELRQQNEMLEKRKRVLEAGEQSLLDETDDHKKKVVLDEDALERLRKNGGLAAKALDEEKEKFEFEKKEYDKQAAELAEEKKQAKVESIRVWREKANAQDQIKKFMEQKKNVKEANQRTQADLDRDYAFVDNQLAELEQTREEFEHAKAALEQYEAYLKKQAEAERIQELAFFKAQKAFFEKLAKKEFDPKELKTFADKFGVDMSQAEKRWKEDERMRIQLNQHKSDFSRNIQIMGGDGKAESILKERRTMVAGRKDSKIRASMAMPYNPHILGNLKAEAKERADMLLERAFSSACITVSKSIDRSKDQMIEEIKQKIKYLQGEIKKEHQFSAQLQAQGASIDEKKEEAGSARNFASKRSFANLDAVQVPGRLDDLKHDLIEMLVKVDKGIQKDKEAYLKEDKRKYMDNSKHLIENIFKVLTLLHTPKKDFDNAILSTMALDEQFNVEKLKLFYEQRIAMLIGYIMRIRENYEFFNNNLDNEILKSS